MRYAIVFDAPAARDFRRLSGDVQRSLSRKLSALADDPHPTDSRKLEGTNGCYRIRQGDYRLIYTVLEDRVIVLVLRVGHRSSVYREIKGLKNAIRRHRDKEGE